ncbi:MAG: segregation/condensation protein A [Actinobacteria bacterium]|nr:segregation/condensation protein A [Actinomycetota bacterium]
MAYKVKTSVFEGPFDLLLHLVSRQRLDINAISIVEITDQYLHYVDRMNDLDLDVASDFLLVAATLLEIKASSLAPKEMPFLVGDELDDLPIDEARDLLVARLLAYQQFKNVALELGARMESSARTHPRNAGIETPFVNLTPDYLGGVTLHTLAVICADLVSRRRTFLLAADHVATKPISLEAHCRDLASRLVREKIVRFSRMYEGSAVTPEVLVAGFLAVLELYKRGIASVRQDDLFGDIIIELIDKEAAESPFWLEEEL